MPLYETTPTPVCDISVDDVILHTRRPHVVVNQRTRPDGTSSFDLESPRGLLTIGVADEDDLNIITAINDPLSIPVTVRPTLVTQIQPGHVIRYRSMSWIVRSVFEYEKFIVLEITRGTEVDSPSYWLTERIDVVAD